MDCKTYKTNYEKYQPPLKQAVWQTKEYEEHVEHFHQCTQCSEWVMEQTAFHKGIDASKYCCVEMAYHLSAGIGVDPYQDADVIIIHYKKYDEYGIPIKDGGTSFISISNCPWCGTLLPSSKRDLWWDTLQRLGYEETSEQEIPKEFETDEWWLKLKSD
ncbi:hypothetical protein QFZ77_007566 [Paenibacillus sp. V4I3]|uniref:DUF6980 family protein n=1 Tax=Paenibacillus sp. V4I3 TaxID=3042305 RepID=UPI0027893AA8|nr:hypothetical protein [Paenibacillus sp. V4I3]MDQ0878907.1 hypothetical protein [Paenibacillus sp. V4I3]